MNPTKLALQFSDFSVIFYAIYKKQGKATLLELPFCKKDPGKNFVLAMWSLERLAGAGGQIPASSPRFLAGEW
jgi:hypothetical protein